MQYQVVSAQSESLYQALRELEGNVRELLEEGWTLQGGISIGVTYFDWYCVCQAMVK